MSSNTQPFGETGQMLSCVVSTYLCGVFEPGSNLRRDSNLVCSRTKWLQVRIPLLLLKLNNAAVLSKGFLGIQANI